MSLPDLRNINIEVQPDHTAVVSVDISLAHKIWRGAEPNIELKMTESMHDQTIIVFWVSDKE